MHHHNTKKAVSLAKIYRASEQYTKRFLAKGGREAILSLDGAHDVDGGLRQVVVASLRINWALLRALNVPAMVNNLRVIRHGSDGALAYMNGAFNTIAEELRETT
jgi:hypothetical protein